MSDYQQVTFDGRLVGGVKFAISPMPLEEIPPGMDSAALAGLKHGDFIEAVVRFRVQDAGADEKLDKQDGTATGPLKKAYRLVMIREGFRVNSILSKDEWEAAWRQSHGAPGA